MHGTTPAASERGSFFKELGLGISFLGAIKTQGMIPGPHGLGYF
jgi:hypothetical protein